MADQKIGVHVEFFLKEVLDKKATKEKGFEIHKDVEYVRVRFPGDPKRIHEQMAHEPSVRMPGRDGLVSHAELFPKHYELFKAGLDQRVGTSLTVLHLSPATVATCEANGINSVELLAGMADGRIKAMPMGFRKHVDMAKAFLAQKEKGGARAAALEAELVAMRAEMDELRASLQAKPATEDTDSLDVDFSSWEAEDIRNYLADLGEDVPASARKPTLIKMALAAIKARQKKAA